MNKGNFKQFTEASLGDLASAYISELKHGSLPLPHPPAALVPLLVPCQALSSFSAFAPTVPSTQSARPLSCSSCGSFLIRATGLLREASYTLPHTAWACSLACEAHAVAQLWSHQVAQLGPLTDQACGCEPVPSPLSFRCPICKMGLNPHGLRGSNETQEVGVLTRGALHMHRKCSPGPLTLSVPGLL